MKFLQRFFPKTPKTPRPPQFAGHFYPENPDALRALLDAQLQGSSSGPMPRALIVPFSELEVMGHVVASAYQRVRPHAENISRVVLLSSALRVPFQGLAVSARDAFSSPFGHLWLDHDAATDLVTRQLARAIDVVHDPEPALELHLPYLQHILNPDTLLLPLLMGDGGVEHVLPALETLWTDPSTLFIIPTELAREVSVDEGARLDAQTLEEIRTLQGDGISRLHASARVPVRAILTLARRHGLQAEVLAQGHSGEVTGRRDAVVGYASVALHTPA